MGFPLCLVSAQLSLLVLYALVTTHAVSCSHYRLDQDKERYHSVASLFCAMEVEESQESQESPMDCGVQGTEGVGEVHEEMEVDNDAEGKDESGPTSTEMNDPSSMPAKEEPMPNKPGATKKCDEGAPTTGDQGDPPMADEPGATTKCDEGAPTMGDQGDPPMADEPAQGDLTMADKPAATTKCDEGAPTTSDQGDLTMADEPGATTKCDEGAPTTGDQGDPPMADEPGATTKCDEGAPTTSDQGDPPMADEPAATTKCDEGAPTTGDQGDPPMADEPGATTKCDEGAPTTGDQGDPPMADEPAATTKCDEGAPTTGDQGDPPMADEPAATTKCDEGAPTTGDQGDPPMADEPAATTKCDEGAPTTGDQGDPPMADEPAATTKCDEGAPTTGDQGDPPMADEPAATTKCDEGAPTTGDQGDPPMADEPAATTKCDEGAPTMSDQGAPPLADKDCLSAVAEEGTPSTGDKALNSGSTDTHRESEQRGEGESEPAMDDSQRESESTQTESNVDPGVQDNSSVDQKEEKSTTPKKAKLMDPQGEPSAQKKADTASELKQKEDTSGGDKGTQADTGASAGGSEVKSGTAARTAGAARKMKKEEKFPDTLKGFGYEFADGRLRNIETGEGFVFEVRKGDKEYNQRHYEALGETITEEVYKLLEEKAYLKRVYISKRATEDCSFFFMSEDALTADKLIVLIHGSGVVRAGQWARSLIINDCLESGTQLPYIERAKREGYGVIVTNTNENGQLVRGRLKQYKDSGTPEEHASYVWEKFVKRAKAKHIDIVAHSYGGVVTVSLMLRFFDDFKKRVKKIAFTDSVHSARGFQNQWNWLKKHAVNWVSSDWPLDTEIESQWGDFDDGVRKLSAGTQKHVETSHKSFESVFKYLTNSDQGDHVQGRNLKETL